MTWGDTEFVLPIGTVTLLLLDVVGSSRLREQSASDAAEGMAALNELLDDAIRRHEGVRTVERGEGDSALAAFPRASDAVACALQIQARTPLPVRLGLHTGDVQLRDQGSYMGSTINRCARIRDLSHAGQTLVSQSTHDLVVDTGVDLHDLGGHRLYDLGRPEQLFQLGGDEFPPLRSLDVIPNNLPIQLTSFIGREAELATLRRLLADTRLLTITGPGGCGKTRLAVHTGAAAIDGWPDGIWFVDLAPIANASLVVPALARVLDLKEQEGRSAIETVTAFLSTKRALVVLDNCEHLVDSCAELTAALLRACPSASVLATSREPLGVDGEVTWLVPSLRLPDAPEQGPIASLTACDAVQLFIDRATRARPNFAVTDETAPAVAQICQRLDGIPLAIELAAARVRVLAPQEIAAGLHDRFRLLGAGPRTSVPRHQTLRASIDSSWELLRDEEQVLLRRLGVFAGSFDLDSAERVCGFERLAPLQVLEVLSALVKRSLVVTVEGPTSRYSLLKTIRQFAVERAAEADELDECGTRALDHFASVVSAAEPLLGTDQQRGMAMIDRDLDNIRAAFQHSIDANLLASGALMCGDLFVYWYVRGMYQEGREWCSAIIEKRAFLDPQQLAPVLFAHGYLRSITGDVEAGAAALSEAHDLASACGDVKTEARILTLTAQMEIVLEGSRDALSILRDALEKSRSIGDAWNVIDSQMGLSCFGRTIFGSVDAAVAMAEVGRDAARAGDVDHAATTAAWHAMVDAFDGNFGRSEALVHAAAALRDLGQAMHAGLALAVGAVASAWRGDLTSARALAAEVTSVAGETIAGPLAAWPAGLVALAEGDAIEACRLLSQATTESQLVLYRSHMLVALADATITVGDLAAARAVIDEAVVLAHRLDNQYDQGRVLAVSARLARAEDNDDRAEARLHAALRLHVAAGDRLSITTALESLAAMSNDDAAARLYGAAHAMREVMDYSWAKPEHSFVGSPGWNEGLALSIDDAVTYAQRRRGVRKRPASGWASLTPTELQVVELVAAGLTNAQIAERMFIAIGTTKTHIAHVFTKLGLTTRAQLAVMATKRSERD